MNAKVLTEEKTWLVGVVRRKTNVVGVDCIKGRRQERPTRPDDSWPAMEILWTTLHRK